MNEILIALFLGFVEGLTEFIPVSSTGHLVVLTDWTGLSTPGHAFEVFIQLGAILAVVVTFRDKIWRLARDAGRDPAARRFWLGLAVASLPALALGAAFHSHIKSLYAPVPIAVMLIAGGIVLLALDRRFGKGVHTEIEAIPLRTAFLIGCAQALALVPGVSRSGATIMGALALGVARPAAAEFSFFMAVPVMIAAVAFDLYKNGADIAAHGDIFVLLCGFAAAFVTAMLVLKFALRLIGRYGFAPFALYRIAAGIVILLVSGIG